MNVSSIVIVYGAYCEIERVFIQQIQNIYMTFVQCSTLDQRYTNVMLMFCVCWVVHFAVLLSFFLALIDVDNLFVLTKTFIMLSI